MICCSLALRRASQLRPTLGRTMAKRNIQKLRFTRRGRGYHVVGRTGRDGATMPSPPADFGSAALLIFVRVILELHGFPPCLLEPSIRVDVPGGLLQFPVLFRYTGDLQWRRRGCILGGLMTKPRNCVLRFAFFGPL